MSEPIDREVTLLLLDVAIKQFGANWLQDKLTKNGLLIAKRIVSKQPIIEVEPVRHGRWTQSDALDYKDPNGVIHIHGMCSCCRLIYDFRDMTSRFKFCPDCGARMEDQNA